MIRGKIAPIVATGGADQTHHFPAKAAYLDASDQFEIILPGSDFASVTHRAFIQGESKPWQLKRIQCVACRLTSRMPQGSPNIKDVPITSAVKVASPSLTRILINTRARHRG